MFQPTTFGKYYLYERVAVGGMAELYKAKLFGVGGFEKIMVVKQILPQLARNQEFVEMFIDEAKIAVSLSHGNVVPVYELGKIQGTYYIAMEYVDGKNLAEILEAARLTGRRLPWPMGVYIAIEICKGLDYAHKKKDAHSRPLNIIHRDVSPQNVLISYEGEAKIVDFGIAKAASKLNATESGVIKGKVAYMSPEQAMGGTLDHRSDVFATGILLWEMVTGRRLYAAKSDLDTIKLITSATAAAPSSVLGDLPVALDAICARALTRERDERFMDAQEMQLALSKLLYSAGPGATARDLGTYVKELFTDEIEGKSRIADDGRSLEEALADEKGRLDMVDRLVNYDEEAARRPQAPQALGGPLPPPSERGNARLPADEAPSTPALLLTEALEASQAGEKRAMSAPGGTAPLSIKDREQAAREGETFHSEGTDFRLASETDELLADMGIGVPASPPLAVPPPAAASPAAAPAPPRRATPQPQPPAPAPRPQPAAEAPAPAVPQLAPQAGAAMLLGQVGPAAEPADLSVYADSPPEASSGGGNTMWILTVLLLVGLLGVVLWKTGILDRDKKDQAAAKVRDEKIKEWKAGRPKYGNLELRTEPDEAQVFMLAGPTPVQVPRLDIGQRNWLLVEHPGYKSERVVVRPDQWKPLLGAAPDARETHRAAIHVTLHAERPEAARKPAAEPAEEPPAPAAGRFGQLGVTTTPPGAKVWVLTGYTPSMSLTNLRIERDYDFRVVKEHYLPETVSVRQSDWQRQGQDHAFSRLLPLRPDPANPPADGGPGKPDKPKKKPARRR